MTSTVWTLEHSTTWKYRQMMPILKLSLLDCRSVNYFSFHKWVWNLMRKYMYLSRKRFRSIKTSWKCKEIFQRSKCSNPNIPWSHTPLLHSMQTASLRGHAQAWVVRHLRPWHIQASQKSHIAPCNRKGRVLVFFMRDNKHEYRYYFLLFVKVFLFDWPMYINIDWLIVQGFLNQSRYLRP